MSSSKYVTQNMFCNLAKISSPADLENCYFNLKLTVEAACLLMTLKCLLRSMLHKIASLGTYHIIMKFSSVFNANLMLICNHLLLWIQTWRNNSLHARTYWSISFMNNFSWPKLFKKLTGFKTLHWHKRYREIILLQSNIPQPAPLLISRSSSNDFHISKNGQRINDHL